MDANDGWKESIWEWHDSTSDYGIKEQEHREQGESSDTHEDFWIQKGTAPSSSETPLVLIGLEAICNAVGAGPRTVKRWMKVDGFPARRYSDGVYRASPESVQRWFSSM